jgi:hypothetical protein
LAEGAPRSYQVNLPRLRRRAWWVIFGCIVTAMLFAAVGTTQLVLLNNVNAPLSTQQLAWVTSDEFFIIVSAASLATFVMWLFWLYCAVANLRATAGSAAIWSPVAAVAWNLIPIVNLVMGYFIMRSVWQGSVQRPNAVPILVSIWTIGFAAPTAIALLPAILAGSLTAYDMRAEAAANLLQALACLAQAILAWRITGAQTTGRTIADTFA